MTFRLPEMKKLTHFPRENGGMILRVVQVASPEVTAYGVYLPLFLTFRERQRSR